MRSVVYMVLMAMLCTAGLVAQQNLVPFQGQVIAFSPNPVDSAAGLGDLAPGCGGDRFGGGTPGNVVIDGSGGVLFRARLVSNTGATLTPTATQFAYFYGDSRGTLTKVLRGGEPEPSGTIPGATIGTNTGSNGLQTDPPRLTENGAMMFAAQFTGGAVTTSDDTALYYGTPGNFVILARENDLAPGCGGAQYTNFGALSPQLSYANAAGYAVFQATFPNSVVPVPPVTAANNGGVFRRDPSGTVSLMLRKGDLTPAGEQLDGSLPFISPMNASGSFAVNVGFVVGTGVPAVTVANDKALWMIDTAGNTSVLVREGDPCLPIPGTFYGTATNNWTHATGASSLNVNGQILNWSTLIGAVTPTVDDGALVQLSAVGQTLVYRRGDLAPGVQGTHAGATLDAPNFSSLVQNDAGQVAFSGIMNGGGVSILNDSGVWTGTAGNLQLVMREGDVAPNTGGLTFGNTTSVNIHMNVNGSLFISNTLSNGDSSVWVWDPVVGLQCVVRNGDVIEVQPGVFRTSVGQTSTTQFTNGDGRTLSFANDGTIGLKVSNTDSATLSGATFSSSQIMTVRVGSLTGIAKTISQAAGGTQNLYLNAGLSHAGETYLVLGSVTGTMPGTLIGPYLIPLNFDFYTDITFQNANTLAWLNTFGTLNADGRAVAQIALPPAIPGIAGIVLHHAYGCIDMTSTISFISEPARLEIVP